MTKLSYPPSFKRPKLTKISSASSPLSLSGACLIWWLSLFQEVYYSSQYYDFCYHDCPEPPLHPERNFFCWEFRTPCKAHERIVVMIICVNNICRVTYTITFILTEPTFHINASVVAPVVAARRITVISKVN